MPPQDTRIVSLTITEKGYCQRVDGSLDTDDPNIKWDLKNLTQPRTAIGELHALLLPASRASGGG
jgi:fructuronate reductase